MITQSWRARNMDDPNHIEGLSLLHAGTTVLEHVRSSPVFSVFSSCVCNLSRALGPNLLGIDTGTEVIATLEATSLQKVTRMSVSPRFVGHSEEVVIRTPSYYFWTDHDLHVDIDRIDEMFHAAATALLPSEYTTRRRTNGTGVMLVERRTNRNPRDPRPADILEHAIVIAGLLAG